MPRGRRWRGPSVLHGVLTTDIRESERPTAVDASLQNGSESMLSRTRARIAGRRRDELPSWVDRSLSSACINASRRIRHERQVSYDRPIILQYETRELRLFPVIRAGTRLLIPFSLRDDTMVSGKLELERGGPDPLPVVLGGDVSEENAVTAWISALLGFADATCFDIEHTDSRLLRRTGISPVVRQRDSLRSIPSTKRRMWPSHMQPSEQLAQYSASFVTGHRRRLAEGYTASDEARDQARQVGIDLRPSETWVRPHSRGVPDDVELRFRWNPPRGLS